MGRVGSTELRNGAARRSHAFAITVSDVTVIVFHVLHFVFDATVGGFGSIVYNDDNVRVIVLPVVAVASAIAAFECVKTATTGV